MDKIIFNHNFSSFLPNNPEGFKSRNTNNNMNDIAFLYAEGKKPIPKFSKMPTINAPKIEPKTVETPPTTAPENPLIINLVPILGSILYSSPIRIPAIPAINDANAIANACNFFEGMPIDSAKCGSSDIACNFFPKLLFLRKIYKNANNNKEDNTIIISNFVIIAPANSMLSEASNKGYFFTVAPNNKRRIFSIIIRIATLAINNTALEAPFFLKGLYTNFITKSPKKIVVVIDKPAANMKGNPTMLKKIYAK